MNYKAMMKQVEKRLEKKDKQPQIIGSGLLARGSMPTRQDKKTSTITDEIADYISVIRKQKEELMSGTK